MEIFGIRFAPFNIPSSRRLETLSIAIWTIIFGLGTFIGVSLEIYLLIFTNYWWLAAIYLLWIYYDQQTCENGGRSYHISTKFWQFYQNYFPISLKTASKDLRLDAKRNYLFACFPHGLLSFGTVHTFGTQSNEYQRLFPDHQSKIVILSQNFCIPFLREILFIINAIPSTFRAIYNALTRPGGGNIVAIMPGGVAEIYHNRPRQYRILLKKRKGFVRVALKTGAPLVPLVAFGEVDVFDQLELQILKRFQQFVKKVCGVPPIIPLGRGFFQYSFGILPQRRPITVVGDPIDVEKIEEPSKEQIDDLHRKFTEAFVELFEQQKHYYLENAENVHLIL